MRVLRYRPYNVGGDRQFVQAAVASRWDSGVKVRL